MRKHILAVTTAATVGVLGMTAAAQAATASSHRVAVQSVPTRFRVPVGVATGVTLLCAKGTLTSFTYSGQPGSAVAVKKKNGLELSGVWTTAGSSSVSLTCSGGTQKDTLVVQDAPEPTDIAGVGAQAQQEALDQLGTDYNSKLAISKPHLYYWDAINPVTGALGDTIDIKDTTPPAHTCAQARPNGSSAGIAALETTNPQIAGHPCIDYAASSRARSGSDPNTISFVNLAGDAVTYATENAANGSPSNVPANLSTSELAAIYDCKVTNWDQLPGGKGGKPEVLIPQTSSGTRSFFLSAIGVPAPGACANDLPTTADPGGTLEQDEGVNKAFAKNPQDVIFIYSVGDYISQLYHSGKCFNPACTPATTGTHKGEICVPTKTENLFGCDLAGRMKLNEINSTAPTTPFPLTKSTRTAKINTAFSATFQRILYEVVKSAQGTIPGDLASLFGPSGWACTNATAKTDLRDYGFLNLPTGKAPGDCGFAQ